MKSKFTNLYYLCFISFLCFIPMGTVSAQFFDGFNDNALILDGSALNGWQAFTGSGQATMTFKPGPGYASILVDATKDTRNVWYAVIKRRVSSGMDLSLMSAPNYDLRIKTRIRLHQAPRRVNLSLNTQRTTDFHSNLMEYDIADTVNWHTISLTTKDFDAVPGDNVFGQLAIIDWGLEKYRVDVDYFQVDIVNTDTVRADAGVLVPYRPPIPDVATFSQHIAVDQDAVIDLEYPDMKFNTWGTLDESGNTTLLTVSGTQYVIMRWNLSAFAGKRVAGSGLLELTSHSMQRSPDIVTDFGLVRVVEILGGDPKWNQKNVTLTRFCQGQPITHVLNEQMIIDIEAAPQRGGRNLITISNPVLQRMIDGHTPGLALRPLGAINASFYAMENLTGQFSPVLHFNVDTTLTGINSNDLLNVPDEFKLAQNYPNPFNPETTIRYKTDKPSDVCITLFNVQGQKINVLLNQFQPAGEYAVRWDGRDENGLNVGSGIYLVEMQYDKMSVKRKMMLVR